MRAESVVITGMQEIDLFHANPVNQPVLGIPERYNPARFHNSSTRRFTSGDISITPGQGRVNPSPGHLRVASTPIFEP